MNSDSSTGTMETYGSSTGTSGTGMGGTGTGDKVSVQKVADKAHAAVDTVAQKLGSTTDKVMGWQEEYGEMAREQVRANPLAVVAGAFFVGYIFAKLTR